MRSYHVTFILTLIFHLVHCEWNQNYGVSCNPAECHEENSCYCKDLFQGWWNGGVTLYNKNGNDPKCYKSDVNNKCKCNDCGEANTQCKDWRCDDKEGFVRNGKCYKEI